MKILYVVRRSKEWEENYKSSSFFNETYKTKKLVDVWDSLFKTSWRDFRIKLNDIRLKNQQNIQADFFASSYQIHEFNIKNLLVIPCDDDDWFHPDVTSKLRNNFDPNVFFYRWNYAELTVTENLKHEFRVFSYPTNIQFPSWPLSKNHDSISFNYQSNNYALYAQSNTSLIENHVEADKHIKINKEKFIPETLSVHNFSLASCSFLRRIDRWYNGNIKCGLEEIHKLFKEYPESNCQIPEYFNGFIDSMMNLWRDLKIK